jgi:hypothetical protein
VIAASERYRVLAVWVDERLYFCASDRSRKVKNLALDSQCAVTVEQEPLDLVVEGSAWKVRVAETLQHVACHRRRQRLPRHRGGPPPYEVYEVVPKTAFGFGTDESFYPPR